MRGLGVLPRLVITCQRQQQPAAAWAGLQQLTFGIARYSTPATRVEKDTFGPLEVPADK